jgi:DNA-binding NarL/FixJ family response regulator
MIPGNDVKEFISFCKKQYPGLYIIIISSVTDIHTMKVLFAEGVNGYLSKAVNYSELKTALEKIYSGERYLSTDLTGKLATFFFEGEESKLTKKELEILRIVASGKTVKQTAEDLLISPSTVMAHRRSIMSKLDLHSAAELVKYAYANKLV